MEKIRGIINKYETLSLEELSDARLMDRVDLKFVFSEKLLAKLLEKLENDYCLLLPNSKAINHYRSLYFDSPDFTFYLKHHNRHNHRFKVRYRTYLESQKTFLEIKEKRKGRTRKIRIEVDKSKLLFDEKEKSFIDKKTPVSPDYLEPKLWNEYKRITLVSKDKKERVTLDFDLSFSWKDQKIEKRGVVIAEIKQDNINRRSKAYRVLKDLGVRTYRVSKYCLGVLAIYSVNSPKQNRFKQKLLKINKIENAF